jgi:sensor histidine kinase YesM
LKFNSTSLLFKIIRYKIHHVLFWIFYLAIWVFLYEPNLGFVGAFQNALTIIILHGVASYFNNYYLIPVFLRKREYLTYFISVILTICFVCFIHIEFLLWADTIDDSEKYNLWTADFFISDALGVSNTMAITMTLLFFKQWFEKERLADKLEKLNIETELKYLKSQINPHFLFNSLNSVYALTLTKSEKAPEVVLKLSDILRYILYEGGEKSVGLKKEIEYLQNYLELEKIRYGNRLDANINIIGETSGKEIAPMIFLPFVENSFKHGINSNIGNTFIHIKFVIEDHHLIFEIENNKPAQKLNESPEYQGGIGINNVKKRLNLLYPAKHSLVIDEEGNTFKVILKIDLE